MSKTQRSRAVVLALAGVAIMVCGTPADADPIRFDNPTGGGHFEWFDLSGAPRGLNLTLPAGEQTGVPQLPATFHQVHEGDHSMVSAPFPGGQQAGAVQVGGDPELFLVGVDFGELIPSGFAWNDMGYSNYPGYESPLPYDVPTYLGVEFDLDSGDHYGWIGVMFSSADYTLDAFAWGYETEVGVPIAAGIPEPGTLALLAFGAVAGLRRRRS